ncbi:programmed cell death 1 ligand 1-like [Dendropsophus ebraccatus]|uniref:programmed cell death 1 ligand 1-like n=1 Tax=Dendropsophus ebraccatus TaxID=150705 RepID=UPI0038314287
MRTVLGVLLTWCLLRGLQGFLTCPGEERMVSFPQDSTGILPCLFSPSRRVLGMLARVSWQKEREVEDLVVHFQNGNDSGDKQHELFKNRTMISKSWFVDGNATLRLDHLTKDDAGRYSCWITMYPIRPGLQKKCCVVMVNIYSQRMLMTTTSYGNGVAYSLLDQMLGIVLFILVLTLFLLPSFYVLYLRSRRRSPLSW